MSKAWVLADESLTLEVLKSVAWDGRRVELGTPAKRRIEKANQFLKQKIASGGTFYGINTGFGLLSNVRIESSDIAQLQVNLIRSHAVGVGDYLPDPAVRAMLLLRAWNLCQGHSGVSVKTVQQLLDFLNQGIHPLVPSQGSVGASGDLAPLSHLALPLIGEGKVRVKGRVMGGAQGLKQAGLKPLQLGPKEGLALINGTQFMSAVGSLALLEAEHLCRVADLLGAMTVEALRGTESAFEPEIHSVRPHPGQVLVAANVRRLLLSRSGKPGKSEIARSHEGCGKVQDPYSVRCIPQVHGASRDALAFVRGVLEREINSVTDNPLLFPAADRILSGGNFHGQIVSIAMDVLAIAMAEIASISEQRMEKLINPALSDLPAFLIKNGGLHSGFMIIQVAAASIVSENKTLCHPASVDSIPTSADKEDHVSMGAWAARKAGQVVVNVRRVLAMEALSAAQGIDLLRPLKSSRAIESMHALIRSQADFAQVDRSFHEDLLRLECMLLSPEVVGLLEKEGVK
ncbi:MAG: histidine ammonia-lyase [Oligoflexia bacterium]